jgi:hypothetical protein
VICQLVLLQDEVRDLRKANETLSKRCNHKKSRLQAGGSLNLQEAQALIDKRDITDQLKQEIQGGGSRQAREETHTRRCGNCNTTGHNARTCQFVIETSKEDISD